MNSIFQLTETTFQIKDYLTDYNKLVHKLKTKKLHNNSTCYHLKDTTELNDDYTETKQIYLWVPIINAVLNIQIDSEEDIDIDFQPIITDVFVYEVPLEEFIVYENNDAKNQD